MGKMVAEAGFPKIIQFAQSIEVVIWAAFPPSVPAFLSPLCCDKKSSTQVGLRAIPRKNPCQGSKP